VGIEPSAILSFRDEYLRLSTDKTSAKQIANHTFTIEEFIKNETLKGHILSNQFTQESKVVKIHGHCHQKALSSVEPTFTMLNLPTLLPLQVQVVVIKFLMVQNVLQNIL